MKVLTEEGQVVGVELTRRNLQTLLAKLDGHPPNSACTLFTHVPGYGDVFVKSVENEEHYSDRLPGPVHSDTEAKLP